MSTTNKAVANQLKLKTSSMKGTPALAKALEEEEGNHHDQRFETALQLLAKAL